MSLGHKAERVESATDGRLAVTTIDAAKELKHTVDIVHNTDAEREYVS
jgi:hypothetical protein